MNQWDEIELAPVILIKSAEPVFADRAVDTLKARLRARDPQVTITTVDATTYEPQQLQMLASPSLFSEPRAIVITNLEQLGSALQKDVLEYIEAPADDVVLIMRHNGGVKGKKVLTALAGKAPTITIPQVKKTADKAKAVHADVREAGRAITNKAVDALVDALGSDVRELLVGVRQLLADVTGTIDEQAVHTYFSGRIEATGFHVADAALSGRTGRAIELARHAMSTGVAPAAIVAAMAASVRRLAHMSALRDDAGSFVVQRARVSYPKWQIDRAQRELRSWSEAGLRAAVTALAQADEDVKGASRDPAFGVEKAIIALGRARRYR
ncbi:MAG: DNA polymerase III subunit delta [Actinomycetaceae bacterium]|nr:DNA polymerase III subunit delta [Arcanobacterium sp.]MDD7687290.1 DNA polymerase III subunit delta [Actinomycetaceae bacterium]MDY5273568.1 DNA polymerase III subunit delta [Arcanobacterium sp.]